MASTGLFFCTELFFRINQRLTLLQIPFYLNRALSVIEMAGPYSWDQKVFTGTPNGFGVLALPADCDIGKPVYFTHNTSPFEPIEQIDYMYDWDETGLTSGATRYTSFDTNNPAPNYQVVFQPPGLLLTVKGQYYFIPQQLDSTALTAVPWNEPEFDTVLLDLAEAEIGRVFRYSGWVERENRARALLIEMSKRASANKVSPGELAAAAGVSTAGPQ